MTQGGGQGAGIQLQVGLDLAYFRNQLPSLGTAAAGYSLPIKIHFDRDSITESLKKLGNSLGNKTYKITVQDTNLDIVVKKVDTLADKLKKLSTSINIGLDAGGVAGGTPGTAMKVMAKKLADQFKDDIGAAARTMESMRGAAPFGAGTRSIPGFKAAAQGMGLENAFKLFFQELKQVDPQRLAKVLDDGSTMMMRENADIKQGLDAIQSKAKKLASDLGAMGDAAKLTGKAFIEDGGKVLRPQNYGLKIASLLSSVEKLDSDLRKASVETGVDLLSALDDLSSVLRSASNSFVKIAGLSDTLDDTLRGFDTAAKQASRATNAYAERIQRRAGGPPVATAGQPLLSGSKGGALAVQTAGFDPYRVITTQVRESFDIIEDYHKRQLDNFISDYKKIIDQYHRNLLIAAARQQVRNVQVSELAPRPAQGMLSGTRIAGLLSPEPPGRYRTSRAEETQADIFARREREARMRSALREMDVMGGGAGRPASPYSYVNRPAMPRRPTSAMVPYAAGGALVPMGGGGGGGVPPRLPSGGGGGGMGGFGRALGGINLPGTGVVREIGNEFAMATKQVLLFGTAYKALAFLTSFPSQVGQAVGALQSFNNTLKAISPTADEARASSQFILDIVDRYNVPLQSARDGFTRLYASMAPAGFQGDEIRDLFTGVSQAAATFGMSADKVDRVNYAFAQMASKGQVMSEELKGQLGDVLPGAMGIFAEAAGMEGPDAIQKFSKALEDGAYKGEAMRVLLKNVSVVLTKEFGPGAEGAARTFQGVINRMQNSTQLLYEAFEPVAVGFLNSVVVPLTSGIKTVADGFSAFFTGINAKTSGGFAIARELEKLKPAFDGIGANVAKLLPVFKSFAQVALETSKVLLQIASNPFLGYLGRVYLSVLPLTVAIRALNLQALIPLIASFLRAIPAFVAFTAATVQGATANKALQLSMQLTGQTAAVTATQIRGVSVALKAAFASTVVLAVVAGIGMIIEKLISLGARMDEVRQKALGAAQSIRSMSQTEARQAANQAASDVRLIQGISQRQQLTEKPGRISVSAQEQAALERAGVSTGMVATRGRGAQGLKQTVELTQLRGAIESRQGMRREAEYRQRQLQFEDGQSTAPVSLAPITGAGEAEGKKAKKPKAAKERESQLPMLQLELDKTKELFAIDQQLIGARLADNASLVSSLELQKRLVELKYQGKQIALEQIPIDEKQAKMAALAVEYEKAIMQSQLSLQLDMQKAREDLQKSVEETVKGYELENEYQQRYYELVQQGISPALAKIRVEVEKTFRKEKERISTLIEQYELQKASLEVQLASLIAQGNLSDVDSKRLEDIKERIRLLDVELEKMGLLQGNLPGAQQSAIATAEGMTQISPAQMGAERIGQLKEEIAGLTNIGNIAITVADGIGSAFAQAFQGLISGSMSAKEALSGFFKSVGDMFVQMAAEIIAKQMTMIILQTILKALGAFGGGGGGIGASNNYSGAFGNSGLGVFNPGTYSMPAFAMANGGIAPGGFQAFANGGVVNGPTLGLVGEGKYNEAIVPLPNGRSIPVDLGDSLREKMGNASPSSSSSPVLSMSFETTSINGVEYVSRDQLEQAMMETRKLASKEGAMRGANLAIDRLQQSPNIRRRVGMR